MLGVKFDNLHSYTDLGLILTKVEIGSPKPKRNTVEVPGRDGELDLSIYPMRFENRKLTFEFGLNTEAAEWDSRLSKVLNAIHGQKKQVILDSAEDYYWDSFVVVNTGVIDRKHGKIQVICYAAPFKLKTTETVITETINGSADIICSNEFMAVIPTITTDAEITVTIGSKSVTLSAGTHKNASIVLSAGDNTLTVAGSATVTISYREGSL